MTLPPDQSPVGVLGGTFDPIHFGHLHLAETARECLQLGALRFIPAGTPPHRDAPQVSAQNRLEMVRRAVASNPAFSVDAREVDSAAPSYSVVTLQSLRAELGVANRPGYQLPAMPPELAMQFHARMGLPSELPHSPAGKIVCFDITPLAISATQIRANVAAGRSVRYLCPDLVVDYIAQQQLYR